MSLEIRTRRRKTEVESKVEKLIEALKKFQNFKQLAKYNITCILTAITPPTTGWAEAIDYIVENGGVRILVSILQKETTQGEVSVLLSKVLSQITNTRDHAKKVLEQGGMKAALAALSHVSKDNDADSVVDTTNFIKKVAQYDIGAVISGGGVAGLIKVIETFGSDRDALSGALGTLEKITQTPDGLNELVQQSGVPALLGAMDVQAKANETAHVDSCFTIMNRACLIPQNVEYISACGGVDSVINALESIDGESKPGRANAMNKRGGKLLWKLAQRNVKDLVTNLEADEASSKSASLLAYLAVEGQQVEEIVRSGGLNIVVGLLQSQTASNDTIQKAARCLSKIGSDPSFREEVLSAGGHTELIRLLQSTEGDETFAASLVQALAILSMSSTATCKVIHAAGGANAVLNALLRYSGVEGIVIECLNYLAHLEVAYLQTLIQSGAIGGIVTALKQHPNSKIAQKYGTAALVRFASMEKPDGNMLESVSTEMETSDTAAVMVQVLDGFGDSQEIAVATLSVLQRLSSSGYFETLIASDAIDRVHLCHSVAIAGVAHEVCRCLAGELLEQFVLDKEVQTSFGIITQAAEDMRKSSGKSSLTNMLRELRFVQGCCWSARLSAYMINTCAATSNLLLVAEQTSIQMDLDGQNEVLGGCLTVLNQLIKFNPSFRIELERQLTEANGVAKVSAIIRMNPTINVTSGLLLIMTFKTMPTLADLLVSKGTVEAILATMRAHGSDVRFTILGVEALLAMASSEKATNEIARKGACRAIITLIRSHAQNSRFSEVIVKMLQFLNILAKHKDGVNMLRRLDAAGALLVVLDTTFQSDAIFKKTQTLCNSIFSKLCDEQLLADSCDKLRQLADAEKVSSVNHITGLLDQIRCLSSDPDNLDALLGHGTCSLLVSTISKLANEEESEVKDKALNKAIACLGFLASKVTVARECQAGPWLVFVLRRNPTPSILNAVSSYVTMPENTEELLDNGITEAIVGVLQTCTDTNTLRAAFVALNTITSKTERGSNCVIDAGGLVLACKWVKRIETGECEAEMCDVIRLLSTLSYRSENSTAYFHDTGVVKTVLEYLDVECSGEGLQEDEKKNLLQVVMPFLTNVCANRLVADHIRQEFKGGAVLLDIVQKSSACFLSEDIVLSAMTLMQTLHEGGDCTDGKMETFVRAAMDQHRQSTAISNMGASILALTMSSEDIGKHISMSVTEIEQLLILTNTDDVPTKSLVIGLKKLLTFVIIAKDAMESGEKDRVFPIVESVIHDCIRAVKAMMATTDTEDIMSIALDLLNHVSLQRNKKVKGSRRTSNIIQSTMQMYKYDKTIMSKSVGLLSTIADSEGGLETLYEGGYAETLKEIRSTSIGDDVMDDSIANALESIGALLERDSNTLIQSQANGASIVCEMIEAVQHNPVTLRKTIGGVANAENGCQNLMEIMAVTKDNLHLHNAVLKTMALQVETNAVKINVSSPSQALGIVTAINCATSGIESGTCSTKDQKRANEVMDSGVEMMAHIVAEEKQAEMAADKGGIEALLSVMQQTGNRKRSMQCARALHSMQQHENGYIRDRFIELQVAAKIADALRATDDEDDFGDEAMLLLQSICAQDDAEEETGLSDASVLKLGDRKDFRGNILLYESKVNTALDAALNALNTAIAIQVLTDDEGRVYYFDSASGESFWEAPAAADSITNYIENIDNLICSKPESFKYHTIAALNRWQILSMHLSCASNMERCVLLSLKLANFMIVDSESNANGFCEHGGQAGLLDCLLRFHDNLPILSLVCTAWNSSIKSSLFRPDMILKEHIEMLVRDLGVHTESETFCQVALKMMANVSFGSEERITLIANASGVGQIESIMQRYRQNSSILELTMAVLVNLSHGGEYMRMSINERCADEIIQILFDHDGDVGLALHAVRAIGTLAYCEACVSRLVTEGATRGVVNASRKHPDHKALLTVSLDVLANLCAEEADGLFKIVLEEGGPSLVIEAMTKPSIPEEMVLSAVTAATNMGGGKECAQYLFENGYINLVVGYIQEYEYNVDIAEAAIDSLNVLFSLIAPAVDTMVRENGVTNLLSACSTYKHNAEVAEAGLTALTSALKAENGIKLFMSAGGAQVLMDVYEAQKGNEGIMFMVFAMLSRLGVTDEYALEVGEVSISSIIRAMEEYEDNVKLLKVAISTLSHMTLHDGNLQRIVQQNGVPILVDIVCKYPDNISVIAHTIHAIDHIAICSPELCMVVVEAQGKEALELLAETYGDATGELELDVATSCTHSLMTMRALENEALRKHKKQNVLHEESGTRRMIDSRNSATGLEDIQNTLMLESFDSIVHHLHGGQDVTVKFQSGRRCNFHIKLSECRNDIMFISEKPKQVASFQITICPGIQKICRGPAFGHQEEILTKKRVCMGLLMEQSNEHYNLYFQSMAQRNAWVEMLTIAQKAHAIAKSTGKTFEKKDEATVEKTSSGRLRDFFSFRKKR